MERTAFKPLHNVPIKGLMGIGAPLLSFQKVVLHSGDVACNVNRAYIPVSSFQESFREYIISTTEHLLLNFFSTEITALVADERERELPSGDIPYTISRTDMYDMRSKVINKVF